MWLFPAAIFLGAFLFFDLQLISTKQILPWFGGAAAVWTTALLFYQALLLGGYAYAHALTTRLPPRAQRTVHLALIGAVLLLVGLCAWRWGSPLTPPARWRPSDSAHPVGRVLVLLAIG
ncbi:MAG TPA: ferrichrome ABC transporter permease, partial [Thermoanaerobaculia bacterium]|nr:ferrichrome ABC transporter permease [Thermoanaerobaculia bacterium]